MSLVVVGQFVGWNVSLKSIRKWDQEGDPKRHSFYVCRNSSQWCIILVPFTRGPSIFAQAACGSLASSLVKVWLLQLLPIL
jgi:hypothetical protein